MLCACFGDFCGHCLPNDSILKQANPPGCMFLFVFVALCVCVCLFAFLVAAACVVLEVLAYGNLKACWPAATPLTDPLTDTNVISAEASSDDDSPSVS